MFSCNTYVIIIIIIILIIIINNSMALKPLFFDLVLNVRS